MGSSLDPKLFDQAMEHEKSIPLHTMKYEAMLFRGVKIQRDIETGHVYGFNATKNSDDYAPLDEFEVLTLNTYGWYVGANKIARMNYIDKIDEYIVMLRRPDIKPMYVKRLENAIQNMTENLDKINEELKLYEAIP